MGFKMHIWPLATPSLVIVYFLYFSKQSLLHVAIRPHSGCLMSPEWRPEETFVEWWENQHVTAHVRAAALPVLGVFRLMAKEHQILQILCGKTECFYEGCVSRRRMWASHWQTMVTALASTEQCCPLGGTALVDAFSRRHFSLSCLIIQASSSVSHSRHWAHYLNNHILQKKSLQL